MVGAIVLLYLIELLRRTENPAIRKNKRAGGRQYPGQKDNDFSTTKNDSGDTVRLESTGLICSEILINRGARPWGDKGGKKNREKKQRQSDNKLHQKKQEKREKQQKNAPVLSSLMNKYAGTRPSSH
jgi:hypothetical protein